MLLYVSNQSFSTFDGPTFPYTWWPEGQDGGGPRVIMAHELQNPWKLMSEMLSNKYPSGQGLYALSWILLYLGPWQPPGTENIQYIARFGDKSMPYFPLLCTQLLGAAPLYYLWLTISVDSGQAWALEAAVWNLLLPNLHYLRAARWVPMGNSAFSAMLPDLAFSGKRRTFEKLFGGFLEGP